MNETKVYDLPTRIFHWLFAGLFLSSFFIAKVIDDDSSLYVYHMIAGFLMAFLVVLRIGWGFIGTKHARFSSFKFSPSELIQYFSSVLSAKSKRYLGHNPASSYAVLGMFALTIAQVLTGVLMSQGIYKDFFEEVHELSANSFIVLAVVHVVGVILHHVKHNDGLLYSMINGVKDDVEGEAGITSNRPVVAIIFVALFVSFGIYLNKNYDSTTQVINIFGVQLQLGEDAHKLSNLNGRSYNDHNDSEYEQDHQDDDD